MSKRPLKLPSSFEAFVTLWAPALSLESASLQSKCAVQSGDCRTVATLGRESSRQKAGRGRPQNMLMGSRAAALTFCAVALLAAGPTGARRLVQSGGFACEVEVGLLFLRTNGSEEGLPAVLLR